MFVPAAAVLLHATCLPTSTMHLSIPLAAAVLAALVPPALSFYLPGAAPRNYAKGEKVDLFVNALTPMLLDTDNAKLVGTSHHPARIC